MAKAGLSHTDERLSFYTHDFFHGSGGELREAVQGASCVLSCIGNVSGAKEKVVEKATRALVGAIQADSTPPRLVVLTSILLGDSLAQGRKLSFIFPRIIMPCFLAATFKDLQRAEDVLLTGEGKAVESVIVRPCGLTNAKSLDAPGGAWATKFGDDMDVKGFTDSITRSDVARAMMHLATDDSAYRRHVGRPATIMVKKQPGSGSG